MTDDIPDNLKHNPLLALQESFGELFKWAGRILTIALGVFLGLLLFVHYERSQLQDQIQDTFRHAPTATTTTDTPAPTYGPYPFPTTTP